MTCEFLTVLAPYCDLIVSPASRRPSDASPPRPSLVAGTPSREILKEADHVASTNDHACCSRGRRSAWRRCGVPGNGTDRGDGTGPGHRRDDTHGTGADGPGHHRRDGPHSAAGTAHRDRPDSTRDRNGDHLLAAGSLELDRSDLAVG